LITGIIWNDTGSRQYSNIYELSQKIITFSWYVIIPYICTPGHLIVFVS
jgi:actin-related protein 3